MSGLASEPLIHDCIGMDQAQIMELIMKHVKITAGAIALLSALTMSNLALAGKPSSPGASADSPGHEMQTYGKNTDADPGASGYSPGDEMRDANTGSVTPPGKSPEPGASGYAPGDSVSKDKK
jgi:hypothetical protein